MYGLCRNITEDRKRKPEAKKPEARIGTAPLLASWVLGFWLLLLRAGRIQVQIELLLRAKRHDANTSLPMFSYHVANPRPAIVRCRIRQPLSRCCFRQLQDAHGTTDCRIRSRILLDGSL